VRACAAGVEHGDHGNDARLQLRDAELYARHAGYMNVEDVGVGNNAEQQSDIEASPSDDDIRAALDGSNLVKKCAAAFESVVDKHDAERILKLMDTYADGLRRRSFTSEEAADYRAGAFVPLRPKTPYKSYKCKIKALS
jgi:hypothetical protein